MKTFDNNIPTKNILQKIIDDKSKLFSLLKLKVDRSDLFLIKLYITLSICLICSKGASKESLSL